MARVRFELTTMTFEATALSSRLHTAPWAEAQGDGIQPSGKGSEVEPLLGGHTLCFLGKAQIAWKGEEWRNLGRRFVSEVEEVYLLGWEPWQRWRQVRWQQVWPEGAAAVSAIRALSSVVSLALAPAFPLGVRRLVAASRVGAWPPPARAASV